ncbi:hypothetical protein FRC10_005260 [Ceratobasidium sp. 414]|nr:hypothetical protein FRC10_005260 [Ceratobasidium sp. 414]
MVVIGPGSVFNIDVARGNGSSTLVGFGGWVWWRRRQYRASRGSNAGREPLLRVDTTSDVHIHLTNSATSGHPSPYDARWSPHPSHLSPVPTTPHSGQPSPSSPGHQYAYYPETPAYQPHQAYLAPPSAATTGAAPLSASYHAPSQVTSQPPLTGATTNTFASQMQGYSAKPKRAETDGDSGQFPRTPIEPQLPSLPLGDPRNLLPPSVRANVSE